MITSFKFSISLSKPSNLKINFFCKLKNITKDSDASKFASDDTFSSIVKTGLFLVL